MKNIIIAPVSEQMDALFVGLKEFPTEKIILITPKQFLQEAHRTQKELEKFKVPTEIKEITGNIWEETFKTVTQIKMLEKDQKIMVNVATGDRNGRCAATCAAFVNGLKAFSVDEDKVMLLPVLKFSYYKLISDKKMMLLKILYNKDCCSSLEELSKKSKMSLPLISYHINGNLKSEGLKELGLVETTEKKGRIGITLTLLGKLLVDGYITKE
jgi:DNA-binding transcriptional ArsR family regulator